MEGGERNRLQGYLRGIIIEVWCLFMGSNEEWVIWGMGSDCFSLEHVKVEIYKSSKSLCPNKRVEYIGLVIRREI